VDAGHGMTHPRHHRPQAAPGARSRGAGLRCARVILWVLAAALPLASAAQSHQAPLAVPLPDAVRSIAQAPVPDEAPASAASRTSLADLLANARTLIDADRAEEAWRALEARLDDYAGDPEFDYLLGLAALDAGHPGHAILALERVLIVRPDFLQARAEIARAYFNARERENARREFETVAAQRIPEPVRQVIGRYLDAIQRVDEESRGKLTGLLEFELGYDSNVNFGSSSGQWVLADGTAVVPLGVSLPRSSAALSAAGSLNWTAPIGGGWQWTAGGRATIRRYPGAHTLDQDQLDLSSGLTFRRGCHRYNMLAQAQNLQLGGAAFRNALGAIVQWQCDLDARNQVGAYAQHFLLDFPDEPARDARRSGVGLTLAHVFEGGGRPILLAGIQAGRETSRRGLDNLTYGYQGARVAVSRTLGDGWRGFATLSYETRDFDGIEPFFGVARYDRQTDLGIGAERPLSGAWSIAPSLTFTRNRSTLAPNDFRRTQAGVMVRYRFP